MRAVLRSGIVWWSSRRQEAVAESLGQLSDQVVEEPASVYSGKQDLFETLSPMTYSSS